MEQAPSGRCSAVLCGCSPPWLPTPASFPALHHSWLLQVMWGCQHTWDMCAYKPNIISNFLAAKMAMAVLGQLRAQQHQQGRPQWAHRRQAGGHGLGSHGGTCLPAAKTSSPKYQGGEHPHLQISSRMDQNKGSSALWWCCGNTRGAALFGKRLRRGNDAGRGRSRSRSHDASALPRVCREGGVRSESAPGVM